VFPIAVRIKIQRHVFDLGVKLCGTLNHRPDRIEPALHR